MMRSIVALLAIAILLSGCDSAPSPPDPAATPSGASTSPIKPFVGRPLEAGAIEMRLRPDKVYWIDDRSGRFRFEGWYAFADGVLTLETGRGNVGSAKFPKRCMFVPDSSGRGFRLGAIDGGCALLADVEFKIPERP
jgi:hypothetical protein